MKKKIKTIIFILIAIILLLIIILSCMTKEKKKVETPIEMSQMEELLYYYHCKNVRIQQASKEPFQIDIYLTFGEDLWIDGYANTAYYEAIVRNLTELLKYQNYQIIDDSRKLTIGVVADATNRTIENMYINGSTDYFAREESKKQIGTYQQVKTTGIKVQAKELQDYIKQKWDPHKVSLGTLESRFLDYDIYFDEGMEVKTIGGKVYNLVFTERYSKAVINNLKVDSSKEQIVQALGEPTFEEESVIGYKGEECYVFFSKNAISVYPRQQETQFEEFIKLYEQFLSTKNEQDFIRNVTELWPDYTAYDDSDNTFFIEYAQRGIGIQFNVSDENGIILYQNYEGSLTDGLTLENMTQENLPQYVYLRLNVDLLFENELRRAFSQEYYSSEKDMAMLNESDFLEEEYGETFRFTDRISNLFYLEYTYIPKEGIRNLLFISKNRQYPNSQLIRHLQVNCYGWQDDENFIYSVKQDGIYQYNARTGRLRTLVTGNDVFEIKKIEGNTLFYDETSLTLN